jgi:hypothetical protein
MFGLKISLLSLTCFLFQILLVGLILRARIDNAARDLIVLQGSSRHVFRPLLNHLSNQNIDHRCASSVNIHMSLKMKYYCRFLVGLRSRIVIYRPATRSGCGHLPRPGAPPPLRMDLELGTCGFLYSLAYHSLSPLQPDASIRFGI